MLHPLSPLAVSLTGEAPATGGAAPRGIQVEYRETGIYLPEIDLWLDNTEPCAATWISHGHSDHARGCHGRVIGTSTTLRFYRKRLWLAEMRTSRLQCLSTSAKVSSGMVRV